MTDTAGSIYRMPYGFGPSFSPRQFPKDRGFDWSDHSFTAIRASFRSDAALLDKLLPPGFSLLDPIVTIAFAYIKNLPWLAGRGYNTLNVRVPATFHGKEKVTGAFSLVLWENMADPIITGREELGIAKIYCDLPDPTNAGGTTICEASWYGFQFLKLAVSDWTDGKPTGEPDTGGSMLHYKYMPKTGEWGAADVAYTTLTPQVHDATIVSQEIGKGQLAFTKPRWEDMPTQSHIVGAFADLPIIEMLGASRTVIQGGDFSLCNQQIVE
jgi:Acetoacetate decarboxylase (ADC)